MKATFKNILTTLTILVSLNSIHAYAADGDLLIKGNVAQKNCKEGYLIKKLDIDNMPQSTIVTGTSWTPKSKFEGVTVASVLKKAGASGKVLSFHALNDYEVDIPISDVNRFHIIMATKMNGKQLSIRDFGPYFIVYPRDDNMQELDRPKYLARWIWQIDSITVK